jgi:hypothetical protein
MGTVITPGGRVGSDSPLGRPGGPGLFKVKGLTLPRYIRIVANGLMKKGVPKQRAIEMAVGLMYDWARGSNPGGRGGKVTPKVQAAAAAALAEWQAAKARARSIPNKRSSRSK